MGALILFVADNPTLLPSVERLLKRYGFGVLLASDDHNALRQLEASTNLPDLIISDISMPTMDGFAFFEEVRCHDEWMGIPFLFLPTRDQIDDLKQRYSLGADDYLVKPLEQDQFLMMVCRKLKHRDGLMSPIQIQPQTLDEAKRDPVMLVAPDQRTPLMPISMVLDLLSRELEPDQVQRLLDSMQSGGSRLTWLVEQIAIFALLQSGSFAATIQDYLHLGYIRDAITGGVDRARTFCSPYSDVPVQFDEQSLNVEIHGDMGMLQHALAELLANAMAFSPAGEIVLIKQWAVGKTVWISIADRGPGIPEEELKRVFVEPYDHSNRERYEGPHISIGLILARGIIKAHGGTLELNSVVGEGTQAFVGLPMHNSEEF